MRVAGVVIWAGELVRSNLTSKTNSRQAYSVSFALALSSRRLSACHRIWADGRLIRDADDRQSVQFKLRLHDGDADQAPDPLMVASLGINRAPAFRDLAYVVFEDFDLSTFGNRLPQITIEISSADGSVDGGAIMSELLAIERSGVGSPSFLGCAISGDTTEQGLEPLVAGLPIATHFRDGRWVEGASDVSHSVGVADPIVLDSKVDERQRAPAKVALRYFDTASDFAIGESSVRLPGGDEALVINLPVAIDGTAGKALAQRILTRAWQEREEVRLRLPLRFCGVEVGDSVALEGFASEALRVRRKLIADDVVTLSLVRNADSRPVVPLPAAPVADEVVPSGQIRLAVVELPIGSSSDLPSLAVVVDGAPQITSVQIEGVGVNEQVEVRSSPGAIGYLREPLMRGETDLFDTQNVVDVEFAFDPSLTSEDESLLFTGANTAALGGEIIQFGTVFPLGGGRYRLTHLLRGRQDSLIPDVHATGSAFVLLNKDSFFEIQLPVAALGTAVSISASGLDGATVTDELPAVHGLTIRPWRPQVLSCQLVGQELRASWVRRGREGAAWLDYVDTPIGAAVERYGITIAGANGASVSIESDIPSVTIPEALLQELGPRPWRLEIRQLGNFTASAATVQIIN
ncbi:hypothetical protein GCM10022281_01890 [Sphingomonas rosea]|uniref:Tip attachment protein J domain-containing protein n=2 Tax=Sphingomonas rosea TaxID=335605 RepID=A0ABP7TKG7_9SPHN